MFTAAIVFSNIFTLPLYADLALFLAAYAVLGGDVVFKAAKNILKGKVFDENSLMSIATIGAFVTGEYPEAVAVMLFYQVGELFQEMAVRKSKKSIAVLMDIRPDTATVKRNKELLTVAPETVAAGETILVKPGEKIPLDGLVIEGESMLDTKALTGESVPRSIKTGDNVLSGCINQNGVLTI
jgi:Cd2+/Zn2+-exporting ATPase